MLRFTAIMNQDVAISMCKDAVSLDAALGVMMTCLLYTSDAADE